MAFKTEIIVINQNGKDHLRDCFQSIVETTPKDVLVTLMDNASTDDSIAFVKANFPNVHILSFEKNYGFAGGYDKAIRQSSAEQIIMLNNDIKVLPNWFQPLVEPLQNPNVAITGSRLHVFSNPALLDHAGGKISISGGGIDIGKKQSDQGNFNANSAYACGAAMAFRKSTYIELGGFDSDYIIYHEDVDLGWKATLAGLEVVHVPSSKILHKVSVSMGHFENPRRMYLSQRNRLWNLFKNAGFVFLVQGLLANFLFDFFRIVNWLFTGKLKNIFYLIKADIVAYATFPQKISARCFVQNKIRKISDRELCKKGLISGFFESLRAYRNLKQS